VRRSLLPWLLVAIHMATAFYLSSQPNPLPELTARFWDKGLHFCEYGTLGALLLLALRASGFRGAAALLLAAAGASLYGASDELHQAFVPGRSCDLLDWITDTLGGAAGAALLALALRAFRAPASIGRALGR
jgi:VanZ family protein